MLFDDWKDAPPQKISPTLLWDYDLSSFDWEKGKVIVVQRIVERGWDSDFYAAMQLYGGLEAFIEIVKQVPYLNERDMNFVSKAFQIDLNDLQCYKNKQYREQLLNS